MARPTRIAQTLGTLPSLYAGDPLLRRLIEAVAGRLDEAQDEAQEVMNGHWVDAADRAPLGAPQLLRDLPQIADLVPLAPFPDEETTRPLPATILVDPAAVITGPGGEEAGLEQLRPGQRLFATGTAPPEGSGAALLATRISAGRPLPAGPLVALDGRLSEVEPATVSEPLARLVVLAGDSGVELFRQRLKLTIEAFVEGAGAAPAILKMVAATMGWGPLEGTFADWSAGWTPSDPVFEARAAGAPSPIRVRELPLRPAATPQPHRVKSGARWRESSSSSFVVAPSVRIEALDRPVVIPTLVSLDAQVAIATLVVLETVRLEGQELVEQDVTLRLDGQPDGSLRGTLIERRRPAGAVVETDVSDRIRVRASGLRIDRPDAAAFLRGGSDQATAGLVIGDGRRAIRLSARGEGIWGNAVLVAPAEVAVGEQPAVELSYDPALAVGGDPSGDDEVYRETLTLGALTAGDSRLVEARDFTFEIPEGESRWLYFDHRGWALFGFGQWDRTVFDQPPADAEDPEAQFADYPAKGVFDYTAFEGTVFPQEFLRAFRFDDEPASVFDGAFFNDTPEQVEVLFAWQEGQRATIRVDVPLASQRDRERLAFLPEMIRRVKAGGIKMILVPRFVEHQPLGERPPRVWPRADERQPLGETLRLRPQLEEVQPLGERVAGVFDQGHFNHAHFGARVRGFFDRSQWNHVHFV